VRSTNRALAQSYAEPRQVAESRRPNNDRETPPEPACHRGLTGRIGAASHPIGFFRSFCDRTGRCSSPRLGDAADQMHSRKQPSPSRLLSWLLAIWIAHRMLKRLVAVLVLTPPAPPPGVLPIERWESSSERPAEIFAAPAGLPLTPIVFLSLAVATTAPADWRNAENAEQWYSPSRSENQAYGSRSRFDSGRESSIGVPKRCCSATAPGGNESLRDAADRPRELKGLRPNQLSQNAWRASLLRDSQPESGAITKTCAREDRPRCAVQQLIWPGCRE